jgi:pilus assembly protein CpaF
VSLLKRISQTEDDGSSPAASGLSTLMGKPVPTAPERTESAGAPHQPTPAATGGRLTEATAGRATLKHVKGAAVVDPFASVKSKVQTMLAEETNRDSSLSSSESVRNFIEHVLDSILREDGIQATRADRAKLLEAIANDALGFGPIQALLDDESVTEIMVNGPHQIYVERAGKLFASDVQFDDNDHVMRIIDRIVSPLGRRIDESSPYVDARLPDGSRVNAIIPPISLVGPVVTIRKFARTPLTVHDLVRNGSLSDEMAEFMQSCVRARLNLIVSGGTGSGKTTLLNVLSSFIPDDERIVTIEDAAELQLNKDHLVSLEARPANIEGKGRVTIRDLVSNALRMRPDRIVVGEVRGGEALDMLSAMNTGHDGSMTTAHANSPRDVLARLETMVLMAGMDLPLKAVRDQISKAVDLVVQAARLQDGTRRITHISEIQGMEGDVITMQDIFEFEQTGFREGRVIGQLRPTGIRPKFVERFAALGIDLPLNLFGATYADMRVAS